MYMNATSLIAFAALFLAFVGVFAYQSYSGQMVNYNPPYFFGIESWMGNVNAFSFVFIFSMLFFGMGAPAAMAMEGAKFASIYPVVPFYDMLFIVPEVFAMLAAARLGEGVMADWSGEGNIYLHWREGIKFLAIGLAFLALLTFLRPVVVPLLG
jgi:hypothetical protein